jgi:hypothetical protein
LRLLAPNNAFQKICRESRNSDSTTSYEHPNR